MVGVRASKRDRSGVIVLETGPCCGLRAAIEPPGSDGVVGLGVDHAKDALDELEAFWGT